MKKTIAYLTDSKLSSPNFLSAFETDFIYLLCRKSEVAGPTRFFTKTFHFTLVVIRVRRTRFETLHMLLRTWFQLSNTRTRCRCKNSLFALVMRVNKMGYCSCTFLLKGLGASLRSFHTYKHTYIYLIKQDKLHKMAAEGWCGPAQNGRSVQTYATLRCRPKKDLKEKKNDYSGKWKQNSLSNN